MTAAVALACVLAIAVSATAMSSTLQTEPDEAIDLEFALLPIGESQAVDVKNEVESARASGGTAPTSGSGSERQQSGAAVGERGAGDAARADQRQSGDRSETTATGSGMVPSMLGPLGRLLALLERLLPLIVGLAVVLALLVRYREQLLAIARARLDDVDRPVGDRRSTLRNPSPNDEVERAWLSLIRRTDVDRPWARTPGECAAAAVNRGYDDESVARLRRLFEEVRYGDRRVTDRRTQRATQHLEDLGIEDRP